MWRWVDSELTRADWNKVYKQSRLPGPCPLFGCICCRKGTSKAQDSRTPAWSEGKEVREEVRLQSKNKGAKYAYSRVGLPPLPPPGSLSFLLLAPQQPAVPAKRRMVKDSSLEKLKRAREQTGTSGLWGAPLTEAQSLRHHPPVSPTPTAPTPHAGTPGS